MASNNGVRAVTVPATTAPASSVIIASPCRLCGWSLAAASATTNAAEGSQTSPAAGTTIASLGTLPPGQYLVYWTVELAGTVAAIDSNNFELTVGANVVEVSVNAGAVGVQAQTPVQINVPAGGAIVAIKNVALATVGAVYSAQLSVAGGAPAQGSLQDSGQIIGEVGVAAGIADTHDLSAGGVYVSTNVKLVVTAGTITGCIYITDGTEPQDTADQS